MDIEGKERTEETKGRVRPRCGGVVCAEEKGEHSSEWRCDERDGPPDEYRGYA